MSVLIRLKPPRASDLARKRKAAANHEQQENSLQTIIESSLMLQFNSHQISGIIGKNRWNNGGLVIGIAE